MDVDDDDDSPRSLSPSSPPPPPPPPSSSAVTLAAPSPHAHPLTLALPFQPHRSSPSPSVPTAVPTGGGREDAWSDGATSTLIDAWGERFLDLSRGNLKQKHWQEVADAVTSRDDYTKTPRSDVQCKNRIDTLKKKYKLEKSKPFPSTWPFFSRLDLLLGPFHKPSSIPNSDAYHESKIAPNPLPPRKAAAFPMVTKRSRSVTSSEEENTPAEIRNSDPYHVPRMSRNPLPPRKAAAFAALGKRSRSRSASSEEENMNIPVDSDNGKSSSEEEGGLPPEAERKRRIEGLRELTRAIVKFGEVYERVESSKIQQAVEMEKQRMGFARELELQRMQFFMKTQMELSQLKRRHHHHHRRDGSRRRSGGAGGGVGGGSSNNHHRHHHHREDGNNDNGNGGIE